MTRGRPPRRATRTFMDKQAPLFVLSSIPAAIGGRNDH